MLKLKDIMTRDVVTARSDMTLPEALELLSSKHISGVPVVDGGKVVGLFTATDVLAFLADLDGTKASLTFDRARRTPLEDVWVSEIMTRVVYRLPPGEEIEHAAEFMRRAQIHRVLVMDEDMLLGMVTTTDIAKAVAEHKIRTRTYVFGRGSKAVERHVGERA